jgi:hypothetical protein
MIVSIVRCNASGRLGASEFWFMKAVKDSAATAAWPN